MAGLEETQAGIKIAGRNINNLRYADDSTLMAESEEELKSLLLKVREESEKVGLKLNILPARLQQYVNCELPDVQAGFRKGRGPRDPIANICWIMKKQESSRKTSISALLTMPKPLTVWITINCGKFWKRWNTRPPDLPLEKPICRSGSNS